LYSGDLSHTLNQPKLVRWVVAGIGAASKSLLGGSLPSVGMKKWILWALPTDDCRFRRAPPLPRPDRGVPAVGRILFSLAYAVDLEESKKIYATFRSFLQIIEMSNSAL